MAVAGLGLGEALITGKSWLLAGGVLSGIAALLHFACIVGGPRWYRFFGAGERMVRLAERGSFRPAMITIAIALMLGIWSSYALSGAGLIPRLPLLRTALVMICAIYLLRAAALPLMLARMPDRGTTFLVVSSFVVLVFGLVYLLGIVMAWSQLGAMFQP
ncbi:hypothetical protein BH10PSE14_BH10PSE14_40830 [soil metagenome]